MRSAHNRCASTRHFPMRPSIGHPSCQALPQQLATREFATTKWPPLLRDNGRANNGDHSKLCRRGESVLARISSLRDSLSVSLLIAHHHRRVPTPINGHFGFERYTKIRDARWNVTTGEICNVHIFVNANFFGLTSLYCS
jgi:hypothetical protein